MELNRSDTAGIKGIAILFMLWHHQFLNTTEYGAFTSYLAVIFKVCVALFLFVSGYGLTRQFSGMESRSALNMFKLLMRRFINFFLPYWFCFVLVVLVGHLCGNTFHDVYPATRNTLKCVILDFFGQMGYNSYLHPWWFNKLILQLYLVFPFLYLVVSSKYSAWVGLVAIIPMQLYAHSIPGNVFFMVEGGIPAFYLGMMCARYRIVPSIPKKVWRIVLASVAVSLIIGLAVLHNHVLPASPYQALLIRALMAFCIVFTFKSLCGDHSLVLSFLGKYSAIMYLTHALLLQLIPQLFYYPRCSFLAFLLFVLVSLLLAKSIDWLQRFLHYDKLRSALVSRVNSL